MQKLTISIGAVITATIIAGIIIVPNLASSQTPHNLQPESTTSTGSTAIPSVKLLKPVVASTNSEPVQLNLRGKIVADGNIRLSATTGATIKSIEVKRGDTVHKGDILMKLGGSKENKHPFELAYDQAVLSKQNIETSLANATNSTSIAIRQAEQQRNALNTSVSQLQKTLDLTRNAGNFAVQGANLALNNLQNTVTRSQNLRNLSGNLANISIEQAQELAQLSIQNTARSLLVSLQGTIIPLLEGMRNASSNNGIREDLDDIKNIVEKLDDFKDVSDRRIPSEINDITSVLYDLMDSIEDISINVARIDTAAAKPLVDAWRQLSGTVTSSVAVSITQLSTTRNQIENAPTNKDIQIATPDNQISASQDQQRVLEMAIAQAQNAGALQEQAINSQIQTLEQQKLSANLGIEAAKASAKTQKESIQGQLSLAEKQLEQTQIQLSQLTLVASMDGYVVDVPVSINEDVGVGRELLTIYGSRPDFIRLSVSPSDRDHIQVGNELMVSLNNSTTEIPAIIDKIAVVSDATGNIPVDCVFKTDMVLPIGFVPGSNVQARTTFTTDESPSQVQNHYVPMSAIVIDSGQTYVWLYQSGIVAKKAVSVGPSQNDQVSILNQLEWSQVVINPSPALQEGQTVTVNN
jgi:RND family efflux transporter MFP subunit